MDQKTWLWKKRSSEKTIVTSGEEVQPIPIKREVELENSLNTLNEKLACVLDECLAKDELVQSCEKTANEAIADKTKAEEELVRLKDELDEVVQQKLAAYDRLSHLNSALKDCMEKLNQLRDEQEQRVLDAVTKATKELETTHKKLQEKLSENNRRLANATSENSYLSKALLVKDKMIEDLSNIKSQTEAEFEALMRRLDSTEKENAFLRYEFRMLQKELELRNEEVECGRCSAEAAHKQHLEDVKKIKRLDADCQRLRGLMRKKLPCRGVLANIKSDIEVDPVDNTRKSAIGGLVSRDAYGPDNATKKLGLLIDRVQDLEKENKILQECLIKKETISSPVPDKCYRNIAHVAGEKHPQSKTDCNMFGASDMSLMDDFVEMEKLAIVAVDVPFSASDVSRTFSDSSKELVLVGNNEFTNADPSSQKPNDWLRKVTSMISEQLKISKMNVEELFEVIRMALEGSTAYHEPSKLLPISGYIGWKSPISSPGSNLNLETNDAFAKHYDLNAAICKIVELVGEFCSQDSDAPDDALKASDYRILVFGWKKCSLTSVLNEFLHSCNNLLDQKIDVEKFIGDTASTLEWITNNCTSYEDHSTIRDEFRKHLGGDGPGTAFELECVQSLMIEMEMMYSIFQVEIKGLKNEMNLIEEPDVSLPSGKQDNVALTLELENELEILKESMTTEDHIENLKAINDDLDTQLTVTRAKLNDVQQKLSCAEVELDNKNRCCEELEGTCLELQLQMESMNNKNSEDKVLLQTGVEITRASGKLAECEETMPNLGKQLNSSKELLAPKQQRSSLRDQLISEDNVEANHNKQLVCTSHSILSFPDNFLRMNSESKAGALVIVPAKKRGGGMGFLAKLLVRRKKASSRNAALW